ncbi:MAG: TlpA disulfide reductase family protein [Bacteroidota bacterium]
MKKITFILFLLILISCKSETKPAAPVAENTATAENVNATSTEETTVQTDIPVVNFEQFEKYLNIEDDNIHVVNFWATWCAPCVKELPYFEAVNQEYKDKNVKVLLVSLDFNLKKLNSFLAKNDLKSEQVLLDDPDQNAWIPKVSSTWSGAIPATVIYTKEKRAFYEQSFTKGELQNAIQQFLN